MQNKEIISERQAAKILQVDPATLLHWRRKGIISPTIFEEKRYATGHIRFFYNVQLLEEWKKSVINRV